MLSENRIKLIWQENILQGFKAAKHEKIDPSAQAEKFAEKIFPFWQDAIRQISDQNFITRWNALLPEEQIALADEIAPDWNFRQFILGVVALALR